MHGIRFWHGAAMALVVVGVFSVLAGIQELVRGAAGIRWQGAVLAVVFGVIVFVAAALYLATTLHEAELPEDAREDLGLDGEE